MTKRGMITGFGPCWRAKRAPLALGARRAPKVPHGGPEGPPFPQGSRRDPWVPPWVPGPWARSNGPEPWARSYGPECWALFKMTEYSKQWLFILHVALFQWSRALGPCPMVPGPLSNGPGPGLCGHAGHSCPLCGHASHSRSLCGHANAANLSSVTMQTIYLNHSCPL